jgi:hypothetical protein
VTDLTAEVGVDRCPVLVAIIACLDRGRQVIGFFRREPAVLPPLHVDQSTLVPIAPLLPGCTIRVLIRR